MKEKSNTRMGQSDEDYCGRTFPPLKLLDITYCLEKNLHAVSVSLHLVKQTTVVTRKGKGVKIDPTVRVFSVRCWNLRPTTIPQIDCAT